MEMGVGGTKIWIIPICDLEEEEEETITLFRN